MFVDTLEGKSIADALVILNGHCLHRMSVEGTGRHKFAPRDPMFPHDEDRTPADFVRRSVMHLLERFREAMKISHAVMYEDGRGGKNDGNVKSRMKGAV